MELCGELLLSSSLLRWACPRPSSNHHHHHHNYHHTTGPGRREGCRDSHRGQRPDNGRGMIGETASMRRHTEVEQAVGVSTTVLGTTAQKLLQQERREAVRFSHSSSRT